MARPLDIRLGFSRDLTRPDAADGDRVRQGDDRVTFAELFFDLIFVFALTQLSSYLYEHHTPLGALEGAVLMLALWWVWIYTTWVTNFLDPAKLPVRSAIIGLAFIAFVMSASIGESFGDRAWAFAIAYVLFQLGRTGFMVLATWRHDRETSLVFVRMLCWLTVGGVFWIVGAVLPLAAQLPLWIAAIAIEYLSAAFGFRVPRLGRTSPESWDVSGAHIAERAALFVLIALGESFLVTGFAFVAQESSVAGVVSICSAFLMAAAMWWIYFDHGERAGADAIESSDAPGRLARTAYTYVHLAVIAGIILASVGDKELLAHPDEASVSGTVAILGGPALFLVGSVLFRRVIVREWMPNQLIGIAALVAGAAMGPVVPPVLLGVYSTVVLAAVAVAETAVRLRRRRAAGG